MLTGVCFAIHDSFVFITQVTVLDCASEMHQAARQSIGSPDGQLLMRNLFFFSNCSVLVVMTLRHIPISAMVKEA